MANKFKMVLSELCRIPRALFEIDKTRRMVSGIYYGQLFNSTIRGCEWLDGVAFSPGRWAVDYQFLYVLYRSLVALRPNSVMEFGLGQTTIMLNCYAMSHPEASIVTVEHNSEWRDFFISSTPLASNLQIKLSELTKVSFRGHTTLRYVDNAATLVPSSSASAGLQMILLDGPFGSPRYSRSQILDLLPASLDRDRFCIIIDDISRRAEQDTARLVLDTLSSHSIKHVSYRYRGECDFMVICSPNLSFLLSL